MCWRLFAMLLAAPAIGAQERPAGQGVNFYSREKEAVLGAQLAQQVRHETTSLESAAVRDFVDQTGRRLGAQVPASGAVYTFAVITGDGGGETHEPLSLPGGYIFVPASLILAAQNEAECAGMIAHAMAHVAARHGTRQATRNQLAQTPGTPLFFIGRWNLHGGQSGQVIPLAFRTAARGFELEADELAVKTASAAGYDPAALVGYIGRVQRDDNARSKLFSLLPSRDSRIEHMEQTIRKLAPGSYASSGEFARIQDEVRRLTASPAHPVPSLVRPNQDRQ